MRLFVTGANGFLGTAVVDAALARGHEVTALVRSAAAGERLARGRAGVTVACGDLRDPAAWRDALAGVEAVVHLAATKSGDFYQQFQGTVIGTESLLAAVQAAGVDRLVHVSSLAVYDFGARRAGARFDETVPVEPEPLLRDAYTQTKLYQEQLVRAAAASGLRWTIVRPGAVWGAADLWTGALGQVVGPLWVALGDGVTSRFTYVESCAEAIVLAAEREQAVGETLNVIDDDLPTQRAYATALRRHGVDLPGALPVPFAAMRLLARLAQAVNRALFGGQARFPGMLVPRTLDAYFKPFRHDNGRAKAVLGWTPRHGFDAALERALAPAGYPDAVVRAASASSTAATDPSAGMADASISTSGDSGAS
jgi:nucleoside-diphosphate-sugar epimerase